MNVVKWAGALVLGTILVEYVIDKYDIYTDSGEISVEISDIILYRTSESNYPYFRANVAVSNTFDENKSIVPKSVTLFDDTITYAFPNNHDPIEVSANSKKIDTIVFSSGILDKALKIPMSADKINIVLNYQVLGKDEIRTKFLDSADVVKCTFWQNPFLSSAEDVEALGLISFWGWYRIHTTHDATGETGKYADRFIMHTSKECESFIMDIVSGFSELNENRGVFPIDLSIFKKKYGGIYVALLESERGKFQFLDRPSSTFDSLGDYEEMEIFGMNFDHDFDSVLEFIHLSFDVSKRNQLFADFQENSKYFIWLLYEEEEGVSEIVKGLSEVGFRVGARQEQFLTRFQTYLSYLPDVSILSLVKNSFNANLENINEAIEMDGAIIYCVSSASEGEFSRLNQIITQIVEKKSVPLFIDGGQFAKYALSPIPIYIALNFSEYTMGKDVDSIAFEPPPDSNLSNTPPTQK